MTLDASYRSEDQRRTLIRAWLDEVQDSGRMVADPLSSATVREVHELYQSMNPRHPMTRNAFGRTLNLYMPGAVRGTGGTWHRQGVRISPAS